MSDLPDRSAGLEVRSFRVVFQLERRLHRIQHWKLPLPYGLPLRGLAYGALVCCVLPGCSDDSVSTLTNLDVEQLNPSDCTVQASSASAIDNVEQVRSPAGVAGSQVLYDVRATSSIDGLPAEPFALAATQPPDSARVAGRESRGLDLEQPGKAR
jgi:hypothetical protein